jgi:hypothetical protein
MSVRYSCVFQSVCLPLCVGVCLDGQLPAKAPSWTICTGAHTLMENVFFPLQCGQIHFYIDVCPGLFLWEMGVSFTILLSRGLVSPWGILPLISLECNKYGIFPGVLHNHTHKDMQVTAKIKETHTWNIFVGSCAATSQNSFNAPRFYKCLELYWRTHRIWFTLFSHSTNHSVTTDALCIAMVACPAFLHMTLSMMICKLLN